MEPSNQQPPATNQTNAATPQGNTTTTNVTTQTRQRKGLIPKSDAGIVSTGRLNCTRWKDSPLTLQWLTCQQYEQYIDNYEAASKLKQNATAARSPQSQQLVELNDLIKEKSENMKGFIIGIKGRKAAPSYYPTIGIQKTRTGYRFPTNQDERLQAMNMMIDNLEPLGLANMAYGKAYWTDLRDRYLELTASSIGSTQKVSQQASVKRELREQIHEAMSALINLVKANYPKTYEAELRAWGFLREKN